MPNQNQPDPNTVAPQSDLPPIIPDFQNVPEEKAPVVGSAAPSDVNISSVIGQPKKKFGTGKIIATILGIFLLVGGVGAGIILTQQPQLFQQKASGSCTCQSNTDSSSTKDGSCTASGDCSCGAGYSVGNNGCSIGSTCSASQIAQCSSQTPSKGCVNGACVGSLAATIDCPDSACSRCACGCHSTDNCATNSCNTNCPTATPGTTPNTCEQNGFVCVVTSDKKCPAGSYSQTGTCTNGFCCTIATTPQPGDASCVLDHYQHRDCVLVSGAWVRCDTDPIGEKGVSVGSCSNSNTSNTGKDTGCTDTYWDCVTGPHCVDLTQKCTPSVPSAINCSADSTCGTPPPTDHPKTPTPTPTSAAPYCVAVKAYSANWTVLTSADLSALTAETVVNFCVSGSAPSGTFDQAKFTINGIELSATTTQRPSSTDYCQSYTILSSDTTVTVSALIHHSTLGWF